MTGTLRIEISNPRLVDSSYTGKALRVDVSMVFTSDRGEKIGDCLRGCLISRDREGVLRFSPSKTRVGSKFWDNAIVTPLYARYVLDTVINTRPRWLERVGDQLHLLKKKDTSLKGQTAEVDLSVAPQTLPVPEDRPYDVDPLFAEPLVEKD
jgi:hypothetical protein